MPAIAHMYIRTSTKQQQQQQKDEKRKYEKSRCN